MAIETTVDDPPVREYVGLPPWTVENEDAVMEPYKYITGIPGRDFRMQLLMAFNMWYELPGNIFDAISDCIGMLHNASLLFDDIEDFTALRRGMPVAHTVYGLPRTINCAAYAMFVAMRKLDSIAETPELQNTLYGIFLEELLELHRGQGIEIFWRETYTCPTEDEYFSMVKQKTGGIFRLGVRLMAACSPAGNHLDVASVVNLFSVFYQVRDDFLNLDSSDYAALKGFADDLTEGKFSFPIVHSISTDKSSSFLMDNLKKRTEDVEIKVAMINYMKHKTKSLDYTRDLLEDVEVKMRQEIASLGGNVLVEAIIDKLHIE